MYTTYGAIYTWLAYHQYKSRKNDQALYDYNCWHHVENSIYRPAIELAEKHIAGIDGPYNYGRAISLIFKAHRRPNINKPKEIYILIDCARVFPHDQFYDSISAKTIYARWDQEAVERLMALENIQIDALLNRMRVFQEKLRIANLKDLTNSHSHAKEVIDSALIGLNQIIFDYLSKSTINRVAANNTFAVQALAILDNVKSVSNFDCSLIVEQFGSAICSTLSLGVFNYAFNCSIYGLFSNKADLLSRIERFTAQHRHPEATVHCDELPLPVAPPYILAKPQGV